jgi:NitT/TauT family transport system ATP-binding protein
MSRSGGAQQVVQARPEIDSGPDAAASTHLALCARALEKRYSDRRRGAIQALGPVDLDVARGEFVCVVGPSGCGKSTLLRIAAGLTRPSEGTVEVRIADEARAPFAMVFQDYGIYPWKTVADNVQFGLQMAGYDKHQRRDIAAQWLGRLGLAEFAGAYPDSLSGGMRQRVAIARALAVDPDVLLMDEPFAALDAQLREVLQDELLSMWQARRRTVLFVTHSLEEALILGDRVIVMSSRPGTIVASVDVPIPRPRSGDARTAPEFGQLRSKLWELLRAELPNGEDRR